MTDEALWQRRLERERAARKEAESLLEDKAAELFAANQQLEQERSQLSEMIETVESSINQLLRKTSAEPRNTNISTAELPSLLAGLINDNARVQKLLARQKFALDQHAIVSISDTDGIVTYVNDRFCKLSGYAREEILGGTYDLVHSAYHPPEFFEQMDAQLLRGEVWSGEINSRAKDGSNFWVAATIVPIFDENNAPVEFIAIQTDLTGAKALEQAFKEEKNFLKNLTDSMDEGVYVIDDQGICLFINEAAARLLGRQREECLNSVLHPGVMAGFDQLPEDPVLSTLGASREQKEQVFEFIRPDGSSFPVSLVASPLVQDEAHLRAVCVIRDISTAQQLEEAREKALHAAQTTAAAKSNFLSNMSHEIRTPLNALLGFSDTLLQSPLEPKQKDYASKIRVSAHSLLEVIDDVLDFSDLDSGTLKLRNSCFDLDEVLQAVYDGESMQAHDKGLSLMIENLAPDTHRLIGDPMRLRQILVKLTNNAIKFSPKGRIRVQVSSRQSTADKLELSISVSDQGVGISAEKLALLGTPFSQGDSSTTRRFSGTGLGLSICYRLAHTMGGVIDVSSTEGEGSCFTLRLELPFQPTPPTTLQQRTVHLIDPQGRLAPLCNLLGYQPLEEQDSGETQPTATLIDLYCVGNEREIGHYSSDAPLILLAAPEQLERFNAERSSNKAVGCNLLTARALANALETAFSRPAAPHVLLVEDNSINALIARRMLERLGLKVSHCKNGEDAIRLSSERRFNLILMDIEMPGLNGYETSRKIREQDNRTPIIALTAHDEAECLANVHEAGMNDLLGKPLDITPLQECLVRWQVSAEDNAEVPTFDTKSALRRFGGDEQLLKHLCDQFIEQHSEDAQRITAAIAEEEPARAALIAHSLKGIAGNLALADLKQQSAELEDSLRRNKRPSEDLLLSFQQALGQAIEAMRGYSEPSAIEEEREANPRLSIDDKEMASTLDELIQLLEVGDIDSIEKARHLAEITPPGPLAAPVARLLKQADNFDFEAAYGSATRLRENLN
ncbi:PAS domain-containing hybrid sensor histidine kinase/response regulator [Marinobacterium lutimaris]|uniref:histidine kinase n=1 Tax=Marinobacterium lutimaris TaxID=568106 RepID=A0A1H6DNT1_9GAMM|nr:PAS domain-containing hybrid sensor histidine kinase/response regulator [Marinobacterium lutimaris]SEG86326.1 hypothetical protein SAMN05444390_107171 [Marinobacterium lutimaris]